MKTPIYSFARSTCFRAPLHQLVPSLIAALCLVSGAVLGADAAGAKKEAKEPKKEAKSTQTKSGSEEKVVITGSLIPQKGPLSRIPVTTTPVVIIDQKDIQRSGATTVAELLRKHVSSR